MWWHLHYVGRGGLPVLAISAIDIGLWDLKCKCLNAPLWSLLGGHNTNVLCYAGNIDLNFSTSILFLSLTDSLRAVCKSPCKSLFCDISCST